MAGPTDTPRGTVEQFDDFLQTEDAYLTTDDSWLITLATCSTATLPAVTDGVARLFTTVDDENASIGGQASWRAQDGMLSMEARVKVDAITTVALSVGFNDSNAEVVLPVSRCGTTLTSTSSNFVGFAFDTDSTVDQWFTITVDDDADGTAFCTGFAPVANTYETFKIVITDRGACNMASARFYRNGEFMNEVTNAIDRDVLLAPFVIIDARTACDRNFDVDYIHVVKTRAA